MLIILIAAVLIEFLTFSVLAFGFPPGMDFSAALYVNSIFAMLVVVASGTWLLTYWLEKRRLKTGG
ncbi:MAG: hypothetical protein ACFFD6_04595 [Candidatus Thorarchaeota archaeon]